MTKKARKGLSVAAAASLAAGMLVGAVAPASAAGVDDLVVAKGLAIDTNYSWDSEGPNLVEWSYDDSWTWELISVPAGSDIDEADFTDDSEGDFAYIGLDDSNGYWERDYNMDAWEFSRVVDQDTYSCTEVDSDGDTVVIDPCGAEYYVRGDMGEFDVPGEYKFEVRGDNKVSIVTIVVGNLNVVRVELAADRNVVADNGDVTFTIKSYDDAGRLTYGFNYDSSDELYEFVEDYYWDLGDGPRFFNEFNGDFEGDEYFDFSNGAHTIVFDINDETGSDDYWYEDFDLNKNYTFEAEVDGIQSNVVTLRIVPTYNVSSYDNLYVNEIAGKAVQVSAYEGYGTSYAAIHKSQRTVSYTFDSGDSDNAGDYVFVSIDAYADDVTSVPASGTWNKLDADGKLTITVTVGETIIDSQDAYRVNVLSYDFTNDEDGDSIDIYAEYWGSGETTSVSLVNNTEYVDYHSNDYQWMVPAATYYVGEAFDEYYKSVLPGQSVAVKVKVTDVFGTVMPNHPVYASYYDAGAGVTSSLEAMIDYEVNIGPDADLYWSEDASYAEFADEVETDANGIATFTLKNNETSAMTQIELWNGFNFYSFGNDATDAYLGGAWVDGFEVYFQTVRSLDVDDLNVSVGTQEDIQEDVEWTIDEWNDDENTIYIDDLDGTDDSYHYDSVTMTYGIVNSDEVLLWGVPVTITATGGYVSEWDEHDVSEMTANTMTFVSWGEEYDWEDGKPVTGEANFTTQKAGATSFTLAAGGKSVTATQTYAVAGSHVARYIAPVQSTVAVSAGDITTLDYKVTDRFGNVVPGVGVEFFYGAANNPVLGSITSSMSAEGETNDSGLVSVDVWTAATVLDQRVSAVTATVVTESAASEGCEANHVWMDSSSPEFDGTEGCFELVDGSTVSAAVGSAAAAISYVVPAVASDVKALKKAFSVSVDNAKGKVVRVYVGSYLKGMFVAKTDAAIRRYKAKAGSKVITVKVEDYSRAETIKVRK